MQFIFDINQPLSIGSDHAGFEYKSFLIDWLVQQGIKVEDKGTFSVASVDYPDFAHLVAKQINENPTQVGILICGSANGVAITANKYPKVRAGIAWNTAVSALLRLHNNANILCLPARFISQSEIIEIATIFLTTAFEGGRHACRVDKIPVLC